MDYGVPDAPYGFAPSVTTSPGSPAYVPDYKALTANNPGYLMAQANANQSRGDATAQRKSAIQQAVVRYGGLPTGFTDKYGDVDQTTLDSAKGNQFSTLSTLADNYAKTQEAFKRSLAARGALQSGDLNYGLDQEARQYSRQQYDAGNTFGDQYTGAINSYAQELQAEQQGLVNAYFQAYQSEMSNPNNAPYPGSPASSANYDPGWSVVAGQPVYSDNNGNLYGGNAQPLNPFSPGAYSGPSVVGAMGIPEPPAGAYGGGSSPAPAPSPTIYGSGGGRATAY